MFSLFYCALRSTAELESFHNHILMYASKRFSFSPPVYAARTMLAGLDYNHHVYRQARRKADGTIQYGKVYNKKSRKWSLYLVKVEKDYSYIVDLQNAIVRQRLSSEGMPRRRTRRPDDPRQHVWCPCPNNRGAITDSSQPGNRSIAARKTESHDRTCKVQPFFMISQDPSRHLFCPIV
ncbi:hypothetical protein UPYG_G00203580 [Umbra pygmaea]|uniref:Uncharacterized protein n=1 Tax=Umbra pygmaea TaxID=75934 RepID=A0ABD0X9A5_UMBPY